MFRHCPRRLLIDRDQRWVEKDAITRWFDLFVLAIRESLLIYDDAFLFFFNFFLRWKYGDDWQR